MSADLNTQQLLALSEEKKMAWIMEGLKSLSLQELIAYREKFEADMDMVQLLDILIQQQSSDLGDSSQMSDNGWYDEEEERAQYFDSPLRPVPLDFFTKEEPINTWIASDAVRHSSAEKVEIQASEKATEAKISNHIELASKALEDDEEKNFQSLGLAQHHINEVFFLYNDLENLEFCKKIQIELGELGVKQYLKEKRILAPGEMIEHPLSRDIIIVRTIAAHIELATRALHKNIQPASQDFARYHFNKAFELYNCIYDLKLKREFLIKLTELDVNMNASIEMKEKKLAEMTFIELLEKTESANTAVALSAYMELAARALNDNMEASQQHFAQSYIKSSIDICNKYIIDPVAQEKYRGKLQLLLSKLLEKNNLPDTIDWCLSIYTFWIRTEMGKDLLRASQLIREAITSLQSVQNDAVKKDHEGMLNTFFNQYSEQVKIDSAISLCIQRISTVIEQAKTPDELKAVQPYIEQAHQNLLAIEEGTPRRGGHEKKLSDLQLKLAQKKNELRPQEGELKPAIRRGTTLSSFATSAMNLFGSGRRAQNNGMEGKQEKGSRLEL